MLLQSIEKLVLRMLELVLERQLPVAPKTDRAILENQRVCRRQLANRAKHGPGHRDKTQRQVVMQRLEIELAERTVRRQNGFDLGGKEEFAVLESIEEGLLAQSIPSQEQLVGGAVPDGEGKHPQEPLHAPLTHLLV